MEKKSLFGFVTIVLGFAGLLHLFRVISRWDLVLGGYSIPAWFSIFLAIIAIYLSREMYKLWR